MRWIVAVLLLGCGAGLAPNEARMNAKTTEAGRELSGTFGEGFSEDEVRRAMVAPECRAAGLSLAELSIEDGAFTALCR